jgi:predicted DNA-binding transcriptional regulator AlpA
MQRLFPIFLMILRLIGMIKLHETGFLRLKQIIGDSTVNPPIPPLIPVSKSTWWAGVKDGIYPKPVKLGKRITAWRVEDIRALMERLGIAWVENAA